MRRPVRGSVPVSAARRLRPVAGQSPTRYAAPSNSANRLTP